MPIAIQQPSPPKNLASILNRDQWQHLAAAVREYHPDIVVLVARKTPRVAACLDLDFGPGTVVMADHALPFAYRHIADSRVAIVDDVVNQGTTLLNASELVKGAATVKLFALAGRTDTIGPGASVTLGTRAPLSSRELDQYAQRVPRALELIPRPFDLDFPIMECRYALPVQGHEQLIESLKSSSLVQSINDLSPPSCSHTGIFRYTLDLLHRRGGNYKIRLFFDSPNDRCYVVPMAIPPVLAVDEQIFLDPWADHVAAFLRTCLQEMSATQKELLGAEPHARINLFCSSLELGRGFLRSFGDLLAVDSQRPFRLEDASLTFGPELYNLSVSNDLLEAHSPDLPSILESQRQLSEPSDVSPFSENDDTLFPLLAAANGFGDSAPGIDLFGGLFQALGDLTGAENPASYGLEWPYTREEVTARPYLRLRIGPTFDDLVFIVRTAFPKLESLGEERIRSGISELLDVAIDQGAVVPTFGSYNGQIYRIYRKGERRLRDRLQDLIVDAWNVSGQPMTMTRVSKVLSVLSQSGSVNLPWRPEALERGMVAVFDDPADWISEETGQVVRYLRDLGRLRRVEN